MPALYPSLMAANPLHLEQEIDRLTPYCHGFHIDVMDNHFVPNLTMGPSFINALALTARKPIWVHLMVQHPKTMIESLNMQPGTIVSFHIESKGEILKTINFIREKKYKPSIAINPKTPITEIFHLLDKLDQVLIMSVNPGFSGQQFMPEVLGKLDPLIAYRDMNKLNFRIGMDGGINTHTIKTIIDRGVDDIAIGSALFNNPDPVEFLKKLTAYTHANT